VATALLKLMKQNCFVVLNAATSGMSYWRKAIMTMGNKKNSVPYFDVCGSCEGFFAKHISTIEICSLCFDKISMDLWGFDGVPTE